MMQVIVYSRPACGPCRATKRALEARGIKYEDRDADAYPEEVERLALLHGRTLPLVVAGSISWGGFQPDNISSLWTPPL